MKIPRPVRILPRKVEPRFAQIDNQAELLPRFRRERARRDLYAGCERAPFGWEGRLAQ